MQKHKRMSDEDVRRAFSETDLHPELNMVRCRQCKYLGGVTASRYGLMRWCTMLETKVTDGFFCAYGETTM